MAFIESQCEGQTRVLCFARPPANAFNLALVEEFAARLAETAADPPAGGLVLSGAGRVFSGGVDFKETPGYARAEQQRMLQCINRAITTLYALPVATVAALNGHAMGGALVLALACDVRLAVAGGTRLALSEVKAGIPYPACPMEVVRAELDADTRRVLVLGGEDLSAEDAARRGLIDELPGAGQLLPRAIALARERSALAGYARVKAQLHAHTLERMRAVIERGGDPMMEGWV